MSRQNWIELRFARAAARLETAILAGPRPGRVVIFAFDVKPTMPNRRSVLLFGSALVLIPALYFFSRSGPPDPVCNGKRLTEWIDGAHDVGIFAQTEETVAALNAIGTNALPFLVNEFTRPIHPWKDRLYTWANRQTFFNIRLRTDEERVRRAGRGLMLLEGNATPALPLLLRCMNDPVRDSFVTEIFAGQGDPAVTWLAAQFNSTHGATTTNALRMLQRLASYSKAARESLAVVRRHPSDNSAGD